MESTFLGLRAIIQKYSIWRKTSQKYKKKSVVLLRRMLLNLSYSRLEGLRPHQTFLPPRSVKQCRIASLAPS
jgi:hypothetical protein